MEEKKYRLQYTDGFISDLIEITEYITYRLSNSIASNNLLDSIDKSITNRLKHPTGFRRYTSKNNGREVYYKIQIKNFTVFYVIIDDIMECRRIVYSHRDLENLV